MKRTIKLLLFPLLCSVWTRLKRWLNNHPLVINTNKEIISKNSLDNESDGGHLFELGRHGKGYEAMATFMESQTAYYKFSNR